MTPEQRRAIEWECTRLINLYVNLNDEGRWEELAALYAEDGLMTRPTAPDAPIVGRAALLESFRSRPPRVSRHVCANIVVDVDGPSEARGFSTILLFTGRSDPEGGRAIRDEGPPLVGTYRDRFVLTGEGWRFAERHGSLTFR